MALRGITLRRRTLLHVPRAFFCSNPPFPPPPPPANEGPDAADPLPSSPQSNPGEPPRNSASSLFQDIRERLRVSLRSPTPRRIPMDHSPKELPDVRQALESFRRSGGLNSSSSIPGAPPSLTDLLKNQRPSTGQGLGGFDTIRQSLKGALPGPQRQRVQPAPFLSVKSDIFKKELERGGKDGKEEEKGSVTTLMKVYSYKDLGKRLGDLRPAGVVKDGKEWFSLEELQGRVAKLVELEKQEHRLGAQFDVIRDSIMQMKQPAKGVQGQGAHMQTMLVLGMQKTPEYMRLPPLEELVEKYFHPDHMSSEEKMKLELQRVRDEFKMSENDCGSARVQIAQLTLKIKYLSAVLHKKDKHSRKGLQEMVQKRKKYLKYLRRTDWDSYCLVLSKLGLRDVPEYKAPDYKSKPITKAKSKKNRSKKNKSKKKMKA